MSFWALDLLDEAYVIPAVKGLTGQWQTRPVSRTSQTRKMIRAAAKPRIGGAPAPQVGRAAHSEGGGQFRGDLKGQVHWGRGRAGSKGGV